MRKDTCFILPLHLYTTHQYYDQDQLIILTNKIIMITITTRQVQHYHLSYPNIIHYTAKTIKLTKVIMIINSHDHGEWLPSPFLKKAWLSHLRL